MDVRQNTNVKRDENKYVFLNHVCVVPWFLTL